MFNQSITQKLKPKQMLARLLQTTVALLLLSHSNAEAAGKKVDGTVLSFPGTSVGRLDIVKINNLSYVDKLISGANAVGKVMIPAGCAINLKLNYHGSQDTRFLLSLPPDAVRSLDCDKLEMSDQQIANIAHLTKMVDLNLESTDLTDAALGQLTGLKELRHLNLGDTLITARGLHAIVSMNKLVWLRLSRNASLSGQIGPDLSRLRSLTFLDLCGTNLDNAMLANLVPLSQLKELNLRRNNVSDKGFVYIAKIKSLEILNATDTLVTIKGLSLLSALPHLRTVFVRMLQYKPEDLAALKKLLPGVKIESGSREDSFPSNTFEPLH